MPNKDVAKLKLVFLISVSVAILLLWSDFLISHKVFEEWDGVMHYFSGLHFWETYSYRGWASNFWPPLQPILISLGDPLVIGKVIAFVSGIVCIISTYYIAIFNKLSPVNAIFASVFIASSSSFLLAFSVVENHAMETGFALLGLSFFLLSKSKQSLPLVCFSALFIALAGLTRYTSYIFALVIALSYFFGGKSMKEGFKEALLFSVVFVAISLFWWVPNFVMNGSPLASWQYLNVGSRIHPEGSASWWWYYQKDYENLSDIIRGYPLEFTKNWVINFIKSGIIIGKNISFHVFISAFLALLIFVDLALNWKKRFDYFARNRVLIISTLSYLALCSLAFVFKGALLPPIIITSALIAIYLIRFLKFGKVLIGLSILSNLAVSYGAINDYLDNETNRGGQLTELNEVTRVLVEDGAELVASIHPVRAYYAKSNWIMLPLYGVQSMCDIVDYDLDKKVKHYAPKYPVLTNEKSFKITHLVIGESIRDIYSNYKLKTKEESVDCNGFNIEEIYNSDRGVTVFRVNY